jgi:hypothetical protein
MSRGVWARVSSFRISQTPQNRGLRQPAAVRQELEFRIIGYVLMPCSPLATDHSPLLRWPWSSWRFYFLNDASILAMDRML